MIDAIFKQYLFLGSVPGYNYKMKIFGDNLSFNLHKWKFNRQDFAI